MAWTMRDVLTRRTKFRLDKAKARAHILEGLRKAEKEGPSLDVDDYLRRRLAAPFEGPLRDVEYEDEEEGNGKGKGKKKKR